MADCRITTRLSLYTQHLVSVVWLFQLLIYQPQSRIHTGQTKASMAVFVISGLCSPKTVRRRPLQVDLTSHHHILVLELTYGQNFQAITFCLSLSSPAKLPRGGQRGSVLQCQSVPPRDRWRKIHISHLTSAKHVCSSPHHTHTHTHIVAPDRDAPNLAGGSIRERFKSIELHHRSRELEK